MMDRFQQWDPNVTCSSICHNVTACACSYTGLASFSCSPLSAHVWRTGRDFCAACCYGTAKCCALPLASDAPWVHWCVLMLCVISSSVPTPPQLQGASTHCTGVWLPSVSQLVDAVAGVPLAQMVPFGGCSHTAVHEPAEIRTVCAIT